MKDFLPKIKQIFFMQLISFQPYSLNPFVLFSFHQQAETFLFARLIDLLLARPTPACAADRDCINYQCDKVIPATPCHVLLSMLYTLYRLLEIAFYHEQCSSIHKRRM